MLPSKAAAISTKLRAALKIIAAENEKNEKDSHSFKGCRYSDHSESKTGERQLLAVIGTFDRIASHKKIAKRGKE